MSKKEKVNVAVISYNSSKTILITLNSILEQNYGTENIDLIITDDGSVDDTTYLIGSWIKKNRCKFFDIKVFFNKSNNGVSKNCNIAWRSCNHNWVKSIGADDVLLPNCISSFMSYVTKNPEAEIIFSYMEWFGNKSRVTPEKHQLSFFSYDALQQHDYLKFFSFNIAPTSFINTSLLSKVGFADESYMLFEDLPLWLKITAANVKLHFNSEVTVRYRIGESISKTNDNFVNKVFIKNCISLNKDYKTVSFPSLQWCLKKEELFLLYYQLFLAALFKNKRHPSYLLYRLGWLLVPTTIFCKLKMKYFGGR